MNLYQTAKGQWAGTIDQARKLALEEGSRQWSPVEVPTDKQGLIAFLNDWLLWAPAPPQAESTPPIKEGGDPSKSETARKIGVEEEIQNCALPRLAVLAQNVIWRMEELRRQAEKGEVK